MCTVVRRGRAPKEPLSQPGNWRSRTFQALKLAACVAFGISLGWFGRPSSGLGVSGVVRSPEAFQATAAVGKKTGAERGFWSLARFEAQKKAMKPAVSAGRYHLHLEPGLNLQKLEGKL